MGPAFRDALHSNLNSIFQNFGDEKITQGSHLEKLCLIKDRVGKDNISDFTNNLIKEFLTLYTQAFAEKFISPNLLKRVPVSKVRFSYETESWERDTYLLPWYRNDYVLLTPKDILTKDEMWINKHDLVHDFDQIPTAIPNLELRAQVDNYFRKVLPKQPTEHDRKRAIAATYREFPQLLDYFIKYKEDNGDRATASSVEKVNDSRLLYGEQFQELIRLLREQTEFYSVNGDSAEESRKRILFLKDIIENKDGYKLFYVKGKPIRNEKDLQICYRLTWFNASSDINREVNNGRGPVDYKASKGSRDSTVIEFKLASNSQLEKNLAAQVEIYQKASDAATAFKVIMFFTDDELQRVQRALRNLKLDKSTSIFLIDARDDKQSASKAKPVA